MMSQWRRSSFLNSYLRNDRFNYIRRRNCLIRSVLILVVWASCGNAQQARIRVESIDEKHLVYSVFQLEGTKAVDLSDLILDDALTANSSSLPPNLRTEWQDVPDFKILLLKSGWAKLRDPSKVAQQYRDAEAIAKSEQIGIWAPPPPIPSPSQAPEDLTFLQPLLSVLAKIFIWLIWFGMGSVIVTAAYYYFYVRRRVRLLIIGKASAGKTAVRWNYGIVTAS